MHVLAARECVLESGILDFTSPNLRIGLAALTLAALAQILPFPALAGPAGAGATHTCVLTATGGVQCSGSNSTGELGNGTSNASYAPVAVSGLSSGVADVVAGGQTGFAGEFSCALTDAGGVKCWGAALSNGSLANQTTPIDVPGLLSGVNTIAAGGGHACALVNGGVKCWGDNTFGQLGDGNSGNGVFSTTPVDVSGLGAGSGVTELATGGFHTCAALAGAIKCWGRNVAGQLGNGNTTNSSLPVSVSGYTSGTKSLAAGATHTCAVKTGGATQCWGDNFNGQLGDGNSNTQSSTPVDVPGLGVETIDVVAGDYFSCAFTAAAAVKCWGYNWDGEVGDDTRFDRYVPTNVIGLDSGMVGVVAGRSHACAGTDTGAIKCWGLNDQGQLGNGTSTSRLTPVDVVGLGSGVAKFAGNTFSSCALTVGGGVKCWGLNGAGQVGDGTNQNRLTPVDVTGLGSGVSALAVGGRHACALTSTNGVKCWGRNGEGQLGDGSFAGHSTPADVTGLTSGVTAIAAGDKFTCALANGGVKCWGLNDAGELGDNSFTNRNLPTDVSGLTSGVIAIAAGLAHSCAVTTGGAVKCWGYNERGALGDGTTDISPVPVDVTGLASGMATVAAGNYHSCATTNAGGVKCWGGNYIGQLGDGTLVDRPQPVDALGLGSGVATLGVSRNSSCVLTNGGGLKCWGSNYVGQVGDGTFFTRTAPTDVSGLTSGVTALGKGGFHNCAVTNAGALKCWGDNVYGEIGDGFTGGVLRAVDSLFSLTPAASVDLIQVPPLPPPASSGSSGASVAAAPEIVVVGAPDSDADGTSSGQVFVYTPGDGPGAKAAFRAATLGGKSIKAVQDLNLATLQMPPELSHIGDKFGGAVAVSHDGNTIAVGAPTYDTNRGVLFLFKKPVDGWTGKVFPSQTVPSPTLAAGDGFGTAVAITNGGSIVVGAPGATASGQPGAGVIYVLKGDTTYTISLPINARVPQGGANFGSAVAGEGSDIAVGAPNRDAGPRVDQGQAEVFREVGGVINPTSIAVVSDPTATAGDRFGASVAINDGTLVVGAPGRGLATPAAGAAEVFDAEVLTQVPDGTATPTATLTDPTADAGAALGSSVSITGGTVVVGEPNVDVNGNIDQGGAMVYTAPETTILTGIPVPDGQLFDPFGDSGDHYGTAVYFGDGLLAVGSPDAGTQANKAARSTADVQPGEAIAYSDSVIFKGGMESARGAVGNCATLNQAIPDPGEITSPDLLLPNTGITNVKDLNISVRITHPFVSNLRLTLIHGPTSKSVPLYIPASACDGDDLDVEFDDQAVDGFARDQCSAGTPTLDGRFLPNDWLTIMQGVTRAGPWRLKVTDTTGGEAGTLVSWCVDAR